MEIEKDNVNNGKDLFEVEETDSTLGKFKLKTIQPYESSRHIPCYTIPFVIIHMFSLDTNATDSGNLDNTIDENRRIIYDAVPNNVIVDDGIKLRIHTDNSDLGFR